VPAWSRPHLWIYLGLFLAVFCVYLQVWNFDFVSLDDQIYVANNPHVRAGLTLSGIAWAFKTGFAGNWFPLTLLSYMLECQLFGPRSGVHHLTNVFLHAIGTLLLYGLLQRMTGARWRSALVAFLFALHPVHVEAVAWIAERKEVLSGLFWFITLWAYLLYVEKPTALKYLWVMLALACGLMSKPMIVTLPFALLLLDYWPLRRLGRQAILEKVPLLALCVCAAIVAWATQQSGGAVSTLALIPLHVRLENALVSYAIYIRQFFVPVNLAVIYPFSSDIPVWRPVGAAILLVAITVLALRARRQRPYLAVGWFWFLGTLLPVIGLVQIGLQSRADRYTYIPFIGISIAVAWGAAEIAGQRKWLTPVIVALCAICPFVTWTAVSNWRDSLTLFRHAIDVTSGNWVALSAYSQALIAQGRVEEAIPYVREALRLQPNLPEAHITLASALSERGDLNEAETRFRDALQLEPENADALEGLGMILTEKGQTREALERLTRAIALRPDDPDSHYNLGRAYALSHQLDPAIAQFREALRLRPGYAEAEYNLGTALAAGEHFEEACDHFRAALRLKPDYIRARFNLGVALAVLGRCEEAAAQFTEVLRVQPGDRDAEQAMRDCEPAPK
jgi:Flp pilus assembly protein TadD